jgi:hypothetical protein
LVSVTITVPLGDLCTSALVNRPGTIANAARVVGTHAVVDVVTNAIGIGIFRAITATCAQSVKLIAITVAVPFRDVCTSTLVNLSWAIANATGIKCAHADIYDVTDAIRIFVGSTIATANAQRIFLVAVAIAIPFWNA